MENKEVKKEESVPLYTDGDIALLREKQMELALDGDRQMLIWLGKTVLGQKPATPKEDAGAEPAPLVLTPDEAAALYGTRDDAP